MFEFNFDNERQLLVNTVTGIIEANDIIEHYEKLPNYKEKARNLKVLIDVRECHFDLKLPELSQTTEKVKSALKDFESIQEAILVDEPRSTAVTITFQNCNSDIAGYRFKVFNTLEAAKAWLRCNF